MLTTQFLKHTRRQPDHLLLTVQDVVAVRVEEKTFAVDVVDLLALHQRLSLTRAFHTV
jgi:hypothetical protein